MTRLGVPAAGGIMNANAREPVAPVGLNHVVINVRDIEISHRFWTTIVGLKRVADYNIKREGLGPVRFYSGVREGGQHHHDIALVEMPSLASVVSGGAEVSAIGHIAFLLADRASWLQQVSYLRSRGIALERVDHGMSRSVYFHDPDGNRIELLYELPRDQWEHDISMALNHYAVRAENDTDATEGTVISQPCH